MPNLIEAKSNLFISLKFLSLKRVLPPSHSTCKTYWHGAWHRAHLWGGARNLILHSSPGDLYTHWHVKASGPIQWINPSAGWPVGGRWNRGGQILIPLYYIINMGQEVTLCGLLGKCSRFGDLLKWPLTFIKSCSLKWCMNSWVQWPDRITAIFIPIQKKGIHLFFLSSFFPFLSKKSAIKPLALAERGRCPLQGIDLGNPEGSIRAQVSEGGGEGRGNGHEI